MPISVEADLVLDFLTEAQEKFYVPYSITLDGLSLNTLFDQHQYKEEAFRIVDSLNNGVTLRVYLVPDGRKLTYYDPFLLSEMDDSSLYELYNHPAFGLKSYTMDTGLKSYLSNLSVTLRNNTSLDALTLNLPVNLVSQNTLHFSNSAAKLEYNGPIRLYDPYLLTDFDPDMLLDMYSDTFF